MPVKNSIYILFVCLGNICRSPSAEGAFCDLVSKARVSQYFKIDSAATHNYHIGNPPDSRVQVSAQKYGVDLSKQRARQIKKNDYYDFDYLIAMDSDNFAILYENCPKSERYKIHKLLDFLPESTIKDVPDPYYEGRFDTVFTIIYQASAQLLENILAQHKNHRF